MLNIDSTGICTCQIADKFFVWWGIFEGIFLLLLLIVLSF